MDLRRAMLAVSDPATSSSDLADIAYSFPELRTQVAVHKAAYPGLLDWLDGLGNPDVSRAVQARRNADSVSASQPSPLAEGGLGDAVTDETVLRTTPFPISDGSHMAQELSESPRTFAESDAPVLSAGLHSAVMSGHSGSVENPPTRNEAPSADASSPGFAVLGFFIPLVGLILFLTWRDQTPLKARSAGMGALVGVIVGVVSTITMYIVILLVFQNMETF